MIYNLAAPKQALGPRRTSRGLRDTSPPLPAEVLVQLVLQVDEAVVGGLGECDVPEHSGHSVRADLLRLRGSGARSQRQRTAAQCLYPPERGYRDSGRRHSVSRERVGTEPDPTATLSSPPTQ